MTIFVAGIHGVGKTYLAQSAAAKLGLRYATASQLIRDERGSSSWDSSKIVSTIEQNQVALTTAVGRIKASGQRLLLDGHFVLRLASGVHERLQPEVFRDLGCESVLLLTCAPTLILSRLLARSDDSWNENEIATFARAETDHAVEVCAALGIPLDILDAPGPEQFESTLRVMALASARRGMRGGEG